MALSTANIGIIGLGQIGCSLGLGLKKANVGATLKGYDANPSHASHAAAMGAVDGYCTSLDDIIRTSNILFLCSPLHTMDSLFLSIGQHAQPGAIITDVGSVKAPLLQLAARAMPHCHFVPGHPIAGTEKSGPTQGNPELFRNQKVFFTPANDALPAAALETVQACWDAMGAKTEMLDAALHDRIYGMTSHLAQLLLYAYASQLSPTDQPLRTGKNSFYQFIRIGGSDAIMWLDIFMKNSRVLLDAAARFNRSLDTLAAKAAEGYSLEDHLTPLNTWRTKSRLMLHPEKWDASATGSNFSPVADLLPLIVAYSYIATAMQEEETLEFSLYPFLGAGFNGVTLPAVFPAPQSALLLSHHATQEACRRFKAQLNVFCEAIDSGQPALLLNLINASKNQHQQNLQRLEY